MIRSCAFIALRHLRVRRRQSLVTILGLAIGVMVLISSISMMDGLLVSFISQMLQISPHITLGPDPVIPEATVLVNEDFELIRLETPQAPDDEKEIKNYSAVVHAIEELPGVVVAAPEYQSEGFLLHGTLKQSVQIHGTLPEKQKHIGELSNRVVAGDYRAFSAGPDAAILGYKLARRMSLGIGDKVQAIAQSGKMLTFRVSALINTGMNSFDSSHVLVHLDKGQQLAGAASDRVTDVNIRITDPEQVDAAALLIERVAGTQAETWQEENANTISMYTMIGRISYFLVIFTMLAAGLGVSNVLTTVVLEKRKDVAVMLSMGYTRGSISLIFLIEGVVLGTIGAFLGCGLGYVSTHLLSAIPMDFGEAAVVTRTNLFMNQDIRYYIFAASFGFLVSLIAGVSPARKAAKLDPVEIIRQEV